MDDRNNDRGSQPSFRRRPGPEIGHGEAMRMTVDRMDRDGELDRRGGPTAADRFRDRYGGLLAGA